MTTPFATKDGGLTRVLDQDTPLTIREGDLHDGDKNYNDTQEGGCANNAPAAAPESAAHASTQVAGQTATAEVRGRVLSEAEHRAGICGLRPRGRADYKHAKQLQQPQSQTPQAKQPQSSNSNSNLNPTLTKPNTVESAPEQPSPATESRNSNSNERMSGAEPQNNRNSKGPMTRAEPQGTRKRIASLKKSARNMGFLPKKLTEKQKTQDPVRLFQEISDEEPEEKAIDVFLAVPTKKLEKHAHIETILEAISGILFEQ